MANNQFGIQHVSCAMTSVYQLLVVVCSLSVGSSLTGSCQLSCVCTDTSLVCYGSKVQYIADYYGPDLEVILILDADIPTLDNAMFDPYPNLTHVTILSSDVTQLAPDTFSSNPSLQVLNLSTNALSGSLELGWMASTPQLTSLDMSSNPELRQLLAPPGVIWSNLSVISMENDPVWCNCEMEWMLTQYFTINTTLLVDCAGPVGMSGPLVAIPDVTDAMHDTCSGAAIVEILGQSDVSAPTHPALQPLLNITFKGGQLGDYINVSYAALYGYVGSTLTLSCLASGIPAPDVKWTLPNATTGVEVTGVIDSSTNTTWANLTLTELSLYSEGRYWCNASNMAGPGVGRRATVRVLPATTTMSTTTQPSTTSQGVEQTTFEVVSTRENVVGQETPEVVSALASEPETASNFQYDQTTYEAATSRANAVDQTTLEMLSASVSEPATNFQHDQTTFETTTTPVNISFAATPEELSATGNGSLNTSVHDGQKTTVLTTTNLQNRQTAVEAASTVTEATSTVTTHFNLHVTTSSLPVSPEMATHYTGSYHSPEELLSNSSIAESFLRSSIFTTGLIISGTSEVSHSPPADGDVLFWVLVLVIPALVVVVGVVGFCGVIFCLKSRSRKVGNHEQLK